MTDIGSYDSAKSEVETPEVENEDSTEPGAEAPQPNEEGDESSGDEGDAEPTDPVAELRAELERNRAELEKLRPYADLGQRLAQSQVEQANQQRSSRDSETDGLVREGLRILYSETDDAKRERAFMALPLPVQREVSRRAKDAEEDNLLRMVDPDKWFEKNVEPYVRKAMKPFVEELSYRSFEQKYPDLQDDSSQQALIPLLQRGVDLPTAAKVVRALKVAQNPAAPDNAEAETTRAVRDARRGRATRKPERASPASSTPEVKGVYLDEIMRELEARGE